MYNAYLVKTKDMRTYTESIMDDGTGPLWDWWPTSIVVAESTGKAKSIFLKKYIQSNTGVYSDDYVNLRTRILVKDIDLKQGIHDENEQLWDRAHEVIDHKGKKCNCPEEIRFDFGEVDISYA